MFSTATVILLERQLQPNALSQPLSTPFLTNFLKSLNCAHQGGLNSRKCIITGAAKRDSFD